jgi:hypothetical protein
MQWDASVPADLIEQLWSDPQALLAAGRVLQEKPRCLVVRINHAGGPLLLKEHNWGGPLRTLKKSFRRSPAKQCWLDGLFLHAAGVPTACPRAYLEFRVGSLAPRSYLLTDFIGGETLYRCLRYQQPSEKVALPLARQVAGIWQQLDEMNVSHNDLKTENFLVDPAGKVWLIDLEKMRRHRRASDVRPRQLRDAQRFFHPRNWRSNPPLAEIFRQQLLNTPCGQQLSQAAKSQGAAQPLNKPAPSKNRSEQLLTVLIPARNDAAKIVECIESVRDIAEEILVADAGSTDETIEIARATGWCRILENPGLGPAAMEQWACRKATHPWVFRLLPHERPSADLSKEIQDLLAKEPHVHGVRIGKRFYFWRRLAKLGGLRNVSSIRLFRKDAVELESFSGVVEATVPGGKIDNAYAKILCDECDQLDRHLAEQLHIASIAAAADFQHGMRPKLHRLLWTASWWFIRSYILQLGFLDGGTGLHASCLAALAIYLREAKLWELQTAAENAVPSLQTPNQFAPQLKVFTPTQIQTPQISSDQRHKRAA